MTLAKEINKKLDAMLLAMDQLNEMEKELHPDAELKCIETGEEVTKDFALNKGREVVTQIEEELNEITNNGQNVRNVFTNQFYVNDMIQDKLIVQEIRLNKMEDCLAKQDKPENN